MGGLVVVGFGNPLRMDDGLGPVAAKRLEAIVHDGDIRFLIRHQLGVELAEELRDADFAIFIDAHLGDIPGTLKEESVLPGQTVSGSFSHHLSPGALLSLVQALYGRNPEATVYSVAAGSLEHGEGFSPPVENALPVLIEKVLERIGRVKDMK